MELGDIADQVRQGLLDLASLIQNLGAGQVKGLVQFVNPVQGPNMTLQIGLLMTLVRATDAGQLENFINEAGRIERFYLDAPTFSASASSSSGGFGDPNQPGFGGNDSDKSDVEQFSVLYHLYSLQDVLRSLSITQLTKIFEILPSSSRIEQLRQLEQLQQLLTQLLPDTLSTLQQELARVPPDQAMTSLVQLVTLDAEHFHLYRALRQLLQMDLSELEQLRESLPRFSLTQLVLITRLFEVGAWDAIDLQNLLNPNANADGKPARGPLAHTMQLTRAEQQSSSSSLIGGQPPMSDPLALALNRQPFGGVNDDDDMAVDGDDAGDEAENESGLRLEIIEQPPEKCVYKRNIKPAPTIMVVGENTENDGHLFVVVILLRCDTGEPQYQLITGNKPTQVTSGRVISFKRLKILVTSHQMNETLFSLRFELRRYADAKAAEKGTTEDFELLGSVTSNPVCVLSHSTQLKPTSSVNPVVLEVIPMCGPTSGLTRVAVLGANFVESPTTRVKFDNIEVMPIFHGPKTLICVTPKHAPGTVQVRVCNDAKRWSESAGKFTYDASLDQEEDYSANGGESNLRIGGAGSGSPWQAAFEGGFETARVLQDNGGLPQASSLPPVQQRQLAQGVRKAALQPDANGYNSLHYAASHGMTEVLLWFITVIGCDAFVRDKRQGWSILHWAVYANQYRTVLSIIQNVPTLLHQTDSEGNTALHIASTRQNVSIELVQLLVASGIAVTAANVDGISALHYAASSGRYDIVELLLTRCGAFINQQDLYGDTALHWAVRMDDSNMTKLLLQPRFGADITIKNVDGETPLYFAASVGNHACSMATSGALIAAGCELTGEEARSLTLSSSSVESSVDDDDEERSCDDSMDEDLLSVSNPGCFDSSRHIMMMEPFAIRS